MREGAQVLFLEGVCWEVEVGEVGLCKGETRKGMLAVIGVMATVGSTMGVMAAGTSTLFSSSVSSSCSSRASTSF